MEQSPKHIVFSDFDGTICKRDSVTILIDRCIGTETRKALDQDMLHGRKTFREAVGYMWDHVNLSMEESEELLKEVEVDSGFVSFVEYCSKASIPIIIVSSGLTWIVALCIERFLGPEAKAIKQIIANDMHVSEDKKWTITWVDDTPHGHDKALSIRQILEQYAKQHPGQSMPATYYIGDGVSDISAASQCDHLFAKKGLDLEKWCVNKGVEFESWRDFSDVQRSLDDLIMSEK